MTGKQVKLFLADGTPGGLITAEIANWTGSIVSARRSDLAELLAREDEDAVGDTRCYIGGADTVATRLRSHAKEKPFWNQAVVVTSKDTNLTKSHVRYLESRLIELARQADRASPRRATGGFSDLAWLWEATRVRLKLIVQPAQSSGVGWISFRQGVA